MNSDEIESLRELVGSNGWKILIELFEKKEKIELESLLTINNLDEMRVRQAYIKVMREMLKKPHELIKEGAKK